MFGIGFWEIVLLLAVIVLLFGAKKIPSIARSLGKSVNEFKAGMNEKGESEKENEAPSAKQEQKK